jgi:hypothetical protein
MMASAPAASRSRLLEDVPATAVATTARIGSIICGEFNEMPGMRLTLAQVCRLWTLTRAEADAVVRSLVERGALAIDDGGRVCRPQDLGD